MRPILFASLLAAAAACSSQREMIREREVRLNEKGEKMYCERTMVTGSHLPVERCMTEQEREEERERSQRMIREGKIRGGVSIP